MDPNTLIFINFLLSILSGVISGVFAALITHRILKKSTGSSPIRLKKKSLSVESPFLSIFAYLKYLEAVLLLLSQSLSQNSLQKKYMGSSPLAPLFLKKL